MTADRDIQRPRGLPRTRLRFAAGRVRRLPLLVLLLLATLVCDTYLWLLKRCRGTVLFPEGY